LHTLFKINISLVLTINENTQEDVTPVLQQQMTIRIIFIMIGELKNVFVII